MSDSAIRTEVVTCCVLCGSPGRPRHEHVQDHFFGTPGRWGFAECTTCGLLWLSPRPVPADIGRAYARYYTHETSGDGRVFARYFGSDGLVTRLRRRVLGLWERVEAAVVQRELGGRLRSGDQGAIAGWLASRVPVVRDAATLAHAGLPDHDDGRVLDVGCGSGDLLARLRERGWSVTGVEPDATAAAMARERYGIEVHVGELSGVAFPDSSFDAVVLSHVIEHVYDPVALLRECGRVLRPDGTIVVLTPNAASMGHRRFGRHWRGLEPPRHLHVFTIESLSRCTAAAGLVVRSTRTSARIVRGVWHLSRAAELVAWRQPSAGSAQGPEPATGGSRLDYLISYLMYFAEDCVRLVRPAAGEEIVLTATRPADAGDAG